MTACKDSTQSTVSGGDETRAKQNRKAETFRNLHIRGNPIVLFNAWDAGSAKAVAAGGAKAIGTSSWSVAAANGFGANLRNADDRADGLLQRQRNLHFHRAQVESRLIGDDGDTRKGNFRVNAARHAHGAVDAAGGQQSRRQDEGAEVGSRDGGKVEHGACPWLPPVG